MTSSSSMINSTRMTINFGLESIEHAFQMSMVAINDGVLEFEMMGF
jgi:hypothetical protein